MYHKSLLQLHVKKQLVVFVVRTVWVCQCHSYVESLLVNTKYSSKREGVYRFSRGFKSSRPHWLLRLIDSDYISDTLCSNRTRYQPQMTFTLQKARTLLLITALLLDWSLLAGTETRNQNPTPTLHPLTSWNCLSVTSTMTLIAPLRDLTSSWAFTATV